jgi:hypothetical protein
MLKKSPFSLILAAGIGAGLWCTPAMALRAGWMKGATQLFPGVEEYKLLIKFRADLEPDLESGGSLTLHKRSAPAHLQALVSKYGIRFSREIQYSEEELREMRRVVRHAYRDEKGFNKYDMAGLMRVQVANPSGPLFVEIANAFEVFDEVDYASLEELNPPPPPSMHLPEPKVAEDFPPTTPDLSAQQKYWGPNPGIDIAYAWSLGLRGEGLAVADLEHSWGRLDHAAKNVHEDLHNQLIAYGRPWRTDEYEDHGTAVMGLLLAAENGYGINGAVPKARGHVYSIVHGDAAALQGAITNSKKGDIILLEMQRGPGSGGGSPPGVIKSLWDLIKKASDAGIVVVETAGNGATDLDNSTDATITGYRARGDAGSIVLGAGSPDTRHDRLSFSTFGKCCVHVQGWGSGVFTLGYGAYQRYGGDKNQEYMSGFSGTSSAGPVVTAAVALIQSYAKEKMNTLLTGKQIRELLVSTGIPQGSGGHIGPLPNLKAAIQKLGGNPTKAREADPSLGVRLLSRDFHLRYSTPYAGERVSIALYDARGALLQVLVDESKAAGEYSVDLRAGGRRVGEGVYYARMRVKDVEKSLRLVAF